jgi:hypothetical protein
MSDIFLDENHLFRLTGFKTKSRQIKQLRKMGIPFFVNGSGHPIVAEAVVSGGSRSAAPVAKTWEPAWAGNVR